LLEAPPEEAPRKWRLHESGDEGTRTPGLRLAKAALSQLSYIPGLSFTGR
jgi:hypothetical protein